MNSGREQVIGTTLREIFSARLSIVQAGAALAALVALSAGLMVVLTAGSGARGGKTIRLTDRQSEVQFDNTLRVVLAEGGLARVRVRMEATEEHMPAGLQPASEIYVVETVEGDSVRLSFTLSDDAENELWTRGEDGEWQFVPSVAAEEDVWVIEAAEGRYALFTLAGARPEIGVVADNRKQLMDAPEGVSVALMDGAYVRTDGGIEASGGAGGSAAYGNISLIPHVMMDDGVALETVLTREGLHSEGLMGLAATFDGLALDYGPIPGTQAEAWHAMIERLAAALHEGGKLLLVKVPQPEASDGGWEMRGVDLARLGAAADHVIVSLPGGPGEAHSAGLGDAFLAWAGKQVSGKKLAVLTPGMSVDVWGGESHLIAQNYALGPLGAVSLQPSGDAPEPGQPLTFGLAGQAHALSHDTDTDLYHYDVQAAGGEHAVWIMTPSALHRRLQWLKGRGVGLVLVEGLVSEDAPAGVQETVRAFAAGGRVEGGDLSLAWQVRDTNETLLYEASTGLDEGLQWTPESEGEYIVSAAVSGSEVRSAASVRVGEAPEPLPTPVAGPVGGGAAAQAFPQDLPPPVVPAGSAAFGRFELGGQVNKEIRNGDYMRKAGMSWVKFQLTWAPGDDPARAWELIQRGREQDFKVLLSIVGATKYPQEIDVESYLEFLRGVAYYGPEAIEVWNEPNYYFEWPQGQMDGGSYVREVLAPAYNAIKEVNPNIMVISAAPLPTGAYYGEGGCSEEGYGCDDWYYLQQMAEAGAANYMDCVGVHYNAGATAPSVSSGHPADPGAGHYSWYFGGMLQLYGGTFGHPVCFTELGYVSKEGYSSLPENFSWANDISVRDQAAWLAEAAQLSRQSGQVRLMIVWNVDFVVWGDSDPKAGYAIVRPSRGCPACDTLGAVMGSR